MLRSLISTAAAVLTVLAGTISAPAAEAANDKSSKSSGVDLTGVAYNFVGAQEDSIIFLTNTDASKAVRAIVTAHDTTGALVGCGVKTLQPGSAGIVYVVTSSKSTPWAETVLNIKVFGLSATGTLFNKVSSQDGLKGQIAQVNGNSGETRSIVPLIESPSLDSDRQAQLDECFTPGAAGSIATLNGGNVITTEMPAKWTTQAKGKN